MITVFHPVDVTERKRGMSKPIKNWIQPKLIARIWDPSLSQVYVCIRTHLRGAINYSPSDWYNNRSSIALSEAIRPVNQLYSISYCMDIYQRIENQLLDRHISSSNYHLTGRHWDLAVKCYLDSAVFSNRRPSQGNKKAFGVNMPSGWISLLMSTDGIDIYFVGSTLSMLTSRNAAKLAFAFHVDKLLFGIFYGSDK